MSTGDQFRMSLDTITLTNQQDDWIKAQVERSEHTNDSEYIRDPCAVSRSEAWTSMPSC